MPILFYLAILGLLTGFLATLALKAIEFRSNYGFSRLYVIAVLGSGGILGFWIGKLLVGNEITYRAVYMNNALLYFGVYFVTVFALTMILEWRR